MKKKCTPVFQFLIWSHFFFSINYASRKNIKVYIGYHISTLFCANFQCIGAFFVPSAHHVVSHQPNFRLVAPISVLFFTFSSEILSKLYGIKKVLFFCVISNSFCPENKPFSPMLPLKLPLKSNFWLNALISAPFLFFIVTIIPFKGGFPR